MSTVAEIEEAVSKLSQEELSKFSAWFREYADDAWDAKFEEDVRAGRLDSLADEALNDLREGRCTKL